MHLLESSITKRSKRLYVLCKVTGFGMSPGAGCTNIEYTTKS